MKGWSRGKTRRGSHTLTRFQRKGEYSLSLWSRGGREAHGLEQYEEIDELKRTNRKLETKLAKERHDRKQLERLLAEQSADDGMKQLSGQLNELIVASAQDKNKFEARESDLLLQIKEFDSQLAESRVLAERLTVQEAEVARRLAESRRISAQRQQDHHMAAKQVDELQS